MAQDQQGVWELSQWLTLNKQKLLALKGSREWVQNSRGITDERIILTRASLLASTQFCITRRQATGL